MNIIRPEVETSGFDLKVSVCVHPEYCVNLR